MEYIELLLVFTLSDIFELYISDAGMSRETLLLLVGEMYLFSSFLIFLMPKFIAFFRSGAFADFYCGKIRFDIETLGI